MMSPWEFVTEIFESETEIGSGNNVSKISFDKRGNMTSVMSDGNSTIVMGNGNLFNRITSGKNVISKPGNPLKTKVDANAKSFSKVSISGPFDVVYKNAKACSINIDYTGSDDILEHVTIYVKKDTLFIEPIGTFSYSGKFTVYANAPTIKSVEINGSGTFSTDDVIDSSQWLKDSNDINLQIRGSGDIKMNKIYGKSLIAKIAGSGDININYVEMKKTVSLSIAGSGDIDIKTVYADSVSGQVAGSGDIIVHDTHTDNIQQQTAGSGSIEFN